MIRSLLSIALITLATACGVQDKPTTSNLSAARSSAKFLKIDLAKTTHWDVDFNLMDDSISGEYVGVAIQIPAKKEQVKVAVTKGENSSCKMDPATNTPSGSVVKIYPSVDVDDGESFCDLEIKLIDGRKAKIHFYEVGT